ncbi:MAG: hypothetical protein FWC70_04315 [Defluviitaleaceae bacterium]|nr:hypothetical protein [Defluviitaleaceae bacterium]
MRTVMSAMYKKKSGIPADVLPIFESIIVKYEIPGKSSLGPECDAEFFKAMEEHLTREQRFRLYEQVGGCKGTGDDKVRKAFAQEHAALPLAERLELFAKKFNRDGRVLNSDNTITVTFACTHGYYRCALAGKPFNPPASLESYFERCAGGRLYELEKALGINLKIKSVDISPLEENPANPVVFTFEVV